MAGFRPNSIRLLLKIEGVEQVESLVVLSYRDNDTLADLRKKIDGVLDFAFDFFDDRLPGRVKGTAERLLPLEEMGGTVVVIRQVLQASTDLTPGNDSVGMRTVSMVADVIDVGDNSQPDPIEENFIHDSKLMSAVVLRVWKEQIDSLVSWMKKKKKERHCWRVKTWDENTTSCSSFECRECHVQTRVEGAQGQMKKKVKAVFSNFKHKHVICPKHEMNFCNRVGIRYEKIVKVESDEEMEEPQQCIDEGEVIVAKLNNEYEGSQKPFTIIRPDVENARDRLYLYKVKCTYCGQVVELVPKKKNLEHNLLSHLSSSKHNDAVQCKVVTNQISSALRSGKRGRPRALDGRDRGLADSTILEFFKAKSSESTSSSKGLDLGMSLLCWGYWFDTVRWTDRDHLVKEILDDQLPGNVWFCEKDLKCTVFNPTTNRLVLVCGTFRHRECVRLSQLGGGFENLICSKCSAITLEDDFRGRVHRETKAPLKRGERSLSCVRFDYRTREELLEESRRLNDRARRDRYTVFLLSSRICCMSVTKRKLLEMSGDAPDRKDLKLFLRNIVNAHKNGGFGGKDALWDFLVDVGKNLNRRKEGVRFSKRTKAICQALFQFGGRQVANIFSQNLGGIGLRSLRRERAKLVQFRVGFRPETFKEIARVLLLAKQRVNLDCDVPVIIAEDETRIKPRIRWEEKYDTLVGFCGSKENHSCSFGSEIKVGNGTDGYDLIVESFNNSEQGIYARVFIINPLHPNLPRMALCAIPTCNKFNAAWVREQWKMLKEMWDLYCRDSVGPLIGHASDGDSRRRKLMMEDYLGKNSNLPRFSVNWEGWKMSCSILPNGDVYGFGDQDCIHNGKKIINPLDRASNFLVLGNSVPSLNHVQKVYNVFEQSEHGLLQDDIWRSDRQNWAGPQRLASRKVQKLLGKLYLEGEYHEKTLGTKIYLCISAHYIDIFFSVTLTIRERIVKASVVSFFLRYWRLWLKCGNHTVATFSGVRYTEKNMLSIQAFHDLNMSCHFVVLLVCLFRDKFSNLAIPFHMLGSDCCELFFSKVGGMRGYERNYDFGTLLDAAMGINRLSSFEHGEEGLIIKKSHSKQSGIWEKLHPLNPGEGPPNLFDYSELETNEKVVNCLKEGQELAKKLCIELEMCPTEPREKCEWWISPWSVESQIWKDEVGSVSILPSFSEDEYERDVPARVSLSERQGEDDPEHDLNDINEWHNEHSESIENTLDFEIMGHETRHAISAMLSNVSLENSSKELVDPTVICDGKIIYKSTLVSLLVGDPSLSKDRQIRVKQISQYSSAKKKKMDVISTHILDVGSDCAVLFDDGDEEVEQPCKGKRKRIEKKKHSFWIGRVQMIRCKGSSGWIKNRDPIDLLDRPDSTIDIHLQWYKQVGSSKVKYEYNTNDHIFISLDNVISTVTMRYQKGIKGVWCLDADDRKVVEEHVKNMV